MTQREKLIFYKLSRFDPHCKKIDVDTVLKIEFDRLHWGYSAFDVVKIFQEGGRTIVLNIHTDLIDGILQLERDSKIREILS